MNKNSLQQTAVASAPPIVPDALALCELAPAIARGSQTIRSGTPSAERGDSEVTDIHVSDVVEDVVRELNRLGRVATINFAVSVGQLVIDKLYGGDVRRWRTRSPRKDYSLAPVRNNPFTGGFSV